MTLIVLAFLPVFGLAIWGAVERHAHAQREAEEGLRVIAEAISHQQQQILEGVRQLIVGASRLEPVRRLDVAACRDLLPRLLGHVPWLTNFGVVRPDGRVLCAARASGPDLPDVSDREWFRTVMRTRDWTISGYLVDRVQGRHILAVSYPALDDGGQVRAVAVGAVGVESLGEEFERLAEHAGLSGETVLLVVDAAGVVLFRRPALEGLVGKNFQTTDLVREMAARREGTTRAPGLLGEEKLWAFAPIVGTGRSAVAYVAVGRRVTAVFADANRAFLRDLVVLGVIAALSLLGAVAGAEWLALRPIRAMAEVTTRLAGGDLAARAGRRAAPAELARLARDFDTMAASLEARAAALADSEARYRFLFEENPLPMYVVDRETLRFLAVNEAAVRHYGYSREEFARMTAMDIRPSDDVPRALAELERLSPGPTPRGSWRHFKKDGSMIEVEAFRTDIEFMGRPGALILVIDVTDRRRMEVEVTERRAAEAASAAASAAKSEFLSRMSHELRTPLNAVLGFAQLLEVDCRTPEQQEGVRHILKAGRHLLDLINEVLDIARIEAGKLTISPEPVLAADAVTSALDLVRPHAITRGIELRTAVVCDTYMRADRQRLQQVLLNLLSNAVKFNRDGGSVVVACEIAAGGRARISVSDTGPGLSADKKARLFTPFDRLGAEGSDVPGTGLGLALSRRLVEAMDGALTVESAVGEGSRFTVELPVTEAPAPPLAPPSAGAESTAVNTQTAGTVLYVEDNLSNVTLIERVLRRRPGVRLLSAMQATLGLELAREHRPDLVLLDLHLPDLPGQVVLQRLRAQPETRAIPVVILTADATPGEMRRLLADGAHAYITKPIDVTRVLSLLDELLGAVKT